MINVNSEFPHQLRNQLSGRGDCLISKIPVPIRRVHGASAFLLHAHFDTDGVAVLTYPVILPTARRLPTAAAMPGIIVVIVIPLPDVAAMTDPKICRGSDRSAAVVVRVGLCVTESPDVMNDDELDIALRAPAGCVVDLHEVFIYLQSHKSPYNKKERPLRASRKMSCFMLRVLLRRLSDHLLRAHPPPS